MAAGSGDGNRKQEAELRAITEEELAEVGGCLAEEFKGNRKCSVSPTKKASDTATNGAAGREAGMEENIISLLLGHGLFEVVTGHWKDRSASERLEIKGAADSGTRSGAPPQVPRGAYTSSRGRLSD